MVARGPRGALFFPLCENKPIDLGKKCFVVRTLFAGGVLPVLRSGIRR